MHAWLGSWILPSGKDLNQGDQQLRKLKNALYSVQVEVTQT